MDKEYAEFLMKKTSQDYNLIASHFSRVREKTWEEFRFLFEEYLIPGEKVLDLGCGNGRFFEFFKEKNIDYFGVDSSEKLIEIAKKKYPKGKFQVANALNLPFPSNFFDKVYSLAVLHHIPSKEFRLRFLKEVKRVLKPEGLLILTVWNLWPRGNLFGILQTKQKSRLWLILKFTILKIFGRSKLDFKDIIMPWHNIPRCYFHCFTKGELEKLAKEAGFKIKKSGEIPVVRGARRNFNFYIILEKQSFYSNVPSLR